MKELKNLEWYKMKFNIKEMAKKAGVSVATISRSLNSETRNKLAPKTLEKVDTLIKKYGYTPHLGAKHLRQSSTKTIGVIFPYFKGIFYHSYYVNIIAGVADCLFDTEYQFKILLLKEGNKKWDHYDFKRGERVDGLIVTHWPQFFSDKTVLEKMDIPSVVISDLRKDMKTYFICGDQISGGRQVAEHLYRLGHLKIAVLTGLAISRDGQLRLHGFQTYLKEKNVFLKPDWIIRCDYREDMAYENVGQILGNQERPTAIFCLNDQMAFGVLRKLRDIRISCPKEVSVVGYDDDPRGVLSIPPLTSVNVPLYDIAKEGARLLVSHLQSKRRKRSFIGCALFPVKLIERSSVQKIPPS